MFGLGCGLLFWVGDHFFGWGRADANPTRNEQRQIDQILASMMAEGPSGGHYGNLMNPKMTRLGVGLIEDGEGKLYFTNDFSG